MREYEVLYIIPPQVDEEGQEAVIQKFSNIITDGKGEILKLDKWGKRRLAYEIKDVNEGFYVLMEYRASKETTQELDRLMKISDDILRNLITVKEPQKSKAVKQ